MHFVFGGICKTPEKAARLPRKGSKVHIQGRMTYPTWKDTQSGATRYGAGIVAQTLDYQVAKDEDAAPVKQPAAEAPLPQPLEPVAPAAEPAPAPAKPKRRRMKAQAAAA